MTQITGTITDHLPKRRTKTMGWLESHLVRKDDPLPAHADVVIGVGCALSPDGTGPSLMSRAIALMAADISKRSIASNVLLVGRGYRDDRVPAPTTEAQAMEMVIKGQVPQNRLFLETNSFTTRRNADEALKIMREHQWTSAIVVAQQWHARRVRATFRSHWPAGYQITVIKAVSPYGPTNQWPLYRFLSFALWDTFAFILYKFSGDA